MIYESILDMEFIMGKFCFGINSFKYLEFWNEYLEENGESNRMSEEDYQNHLIYFLKEIKDRGLDVQIIIKYTPHGVTHYFEGEKEVIMKLVDLFEMYHHNGPSYEDVDEDSFDDLVHMSYEPVSSQYLVSKE